MNEMRRRTSELRCPFLDCKSKQIASVGYVESRIPTDQSLKDCNEHLFQCQKCQRKFLYIGDLSLNNNQ